jgi:hypothetical protein
MTYAMLTSPAAGKTPHPYRQDWVRGGRRPWYPMRTAGTATRTATRSCTAFIEIRTLAAMTHACVEIARTMRPDASFVLESSSPTAFGRTLRHPYRPPCIVIEARKARDRVT